MDNLYDTLTKGLYKIQPLSQPGVYEISPEMIGNGSMLSTVAQNVGNLQNGKTTFENLVAGYILGVDKGVAKFYIGDATNYLNWDGTTLTISGALSATSGTIGGFTIGTDNIVDAANSFGLASTVTGGDDVRFWAGAAFASRATAPFRITEAGVVTATSGTIGGFTLTSTTLAATNLTLTSGAANTANISVGTGSNLAGMNSGNAGSDIAFWAGDTFANRATAAFRVTLAGGVTGSNITITGGSVTATILTGAVPQASLNIANRGWTQTSAFSVTDNDTIAWGAGTFTSADGTAYSISAGNTGNMVAKTYVYLDIGVSTTVYQTTTTASTAVGLGKVLIAVCQNNTTEAIFQLFGGNGELNIDASNIVTGSITANEIAATTITAAKIAASTITGNEILTLNISGKTATFDTGTIGGFTMTATQLTATNFSVTSGAANTARLEVGTGANTGGINSPNGGTDIAFWAGSTFANRATAPFRVDAAGNLTATSVTISGLTDKQVFTANGTWTKPSNVKFIMVVVIGAAGGGGGGKSGGSGGGGGGGGAKSVYFFSASDLTATVAITVGVGGTGGAAASVGVAGTGSSFGSYVYAGGGGGGGFNNTGSAGGGGGGGSIGDGGVGGTNGTTGGIGGLPTGLTTSQSGIAGQGAGGSGNNGNAGNAEYGGGGGGGGTGGPGASADGGSSVYAGPGGGTGGVTAVNGGTGGGTQRYSIGGGAGGAAPAASPAAGTAGSTGLDTSCGTGGGGGGYATGGNTGGVGGVGGTPGGGGGGGGGSNSGAGGAGAAGGRGVVVIYSW